MKKSQVVVALALRGALAFVPEEGEREGRGTSGVNAQDLLSLQSEQCSCDLCYIRGLCVDFLRRKDSNAGKKEIRQPLPSQTQRHRESYHVCVRAVLLRFHLFCFSLEDFSYLEVNSPGAT